MDSEMRWLEQGGWLSHWLARAKESLLAHRPRYRPVRYGGREFSEPQSWKEAALPRGPGLYAIQVRHWWSGLKPIHFGASDNLHEELKVEGAEGFVHWLMHRNAKHGLFVSFHTSAELAHGEARHRERTRLLREYFPRRVHSMEEHMVKHRIVRTPHRGVRGNGREAEEGDSIR
jgi:hypothetical protein